MNDAPDPILICYDGSPTSEHAIQAAGALFAGRPAIVLYVSAPTPERVHTTPVEVVRRELIEEVRSAVRVIARA